MMTTATSSCLDGKNYLVKLIRESGFVKKCDLHPSSFHTNEIGERQVPFFMHSAPAIHDDKMSI